MQVKEFAEYMEKVKVRKKILDEYEDEIVGWVKRFSRHECSSDFGLVKGKIWRY